MNPNSMIHDKVSTGEISPDTGAKLMGMRDEIAQRRKDTKMAERMFMYACGFLSGVAVSAGFMVLWAPTSTERIPAGLPDCRALTDTMEQWSDHRTKCVMDGDQWMCTRGGCERIPAVP